MRALIILFQLYLFIMQRLMPISEFDFYLETFGNRK